MVDKVLDCHGRQITVGCLVTRPGLLVTDYTGEVVSVSSSGIVVGSAAVTRTYDAGAGTDLVVVDRCDDVVDQIGQVITPGDVVVLTTGVAGRVAAAPV